MISNNISIIKTLSRGQYKNYLRPDVKFIPKSTLHSQKKSSGISEIDIDIIDPKVLLSDVVEPEDHDSNVSCPDYDPQLTPPDIDFDPAIANSSPVEELSLAKKFSLTDAVRLFTLRTNISNNNVSHLLDLLDLVKSLSAENSQITLPNKNAILKPSNIISKEHLPLCPIHHCKLENSNCAFCNKVIDRPNYLSVGDLKKQLRSLLDDNNFLSKIGETKNRIASGNLSGIFQGQNYQNILPQLDSNIITFCLNSDGFQIRDSSKIEPWPIYMVVNELDYKSRFSIRYVIIVGIFYGYTHPNVNLILQECLSDQLDVFRSGINYHGVQYYFKLINASLDKPARASLMEMTSHSSSQGCMFCMSEMITAKVKNRFHKYYPYKDSHLLLRCDDDFTGTAISSELFSQVQYGQKKTTFLQNFPDFKIVSVLVIDAMHFLYEG